MINLIPELESTGFYKGKRVLLAGGTGTIGVPLSYYLKQLGAIVSVVSLDTDEYAEHVLPGDVSFKRLDLTDLNNCMLATKQVDIVCNLLTIKGSVGICETKAATYLTPMIWFQTNLMEASYRNSVDRFLFVGSICSYPPAEQPKPEETMWDGLPKQNDRFTGLVKRMAEIQAEAYFSEHNWKAVRIVRPCNVYGPYDDFNPETAQVVPALIRRMIDGENPVKVWGDGSAVRDFIYSDELAQWILVALEKAPPCYPVNMSSGDAVTIKQLAETIADLIDPTPDLAWDTDMPVGDPVRVLSIDRAQESLDFVSRVSLRQGIQKTISWFEKNRNIAGLKGK